MDTRGSLPEIKWLEREVDHSLPTSAEVKEMWIYPSNSIYNFMAGCLIRQRDNFMYILILY
jgi:hypothetical protein